MRAVTANKATLKAFTLETTKPPSVVIQVTALYERRLHLFAHLYLQNFIESKNECKELFKI